MQIKISVILPVKNRLTYLKDVIQSIRYQTKLPYEVIIADDNSDPETSEYLSGLSYPFYKVLRGSFNHPGKARNEAIKLAKGGWIAFVDSDDLWNNNKLAAQLDFLAKHPDTDLLATNGTRFGSETDVYTRYKSTTINFYELFTDNMICTSSVLLKKTLFKELYFFDESINIADDYEFWLRCAKNGKKLRFLGGNHFFYRTHEENFSSNLLENFENTLRVLKKYESFVSPVNGERIASLEYVIGSFKLLKGDFSAKKNFLNCMKNYPFRSAFKMARTLIHI